MDTFQKFILPVGICGPAFAASSGSNTMNITIVGTLNVVSCSSHPQ